MNIKRISNQNMDPITKYNLINGDGAIALKTADGCTLEIADYIIFDDVDNYGKEKTVLSLTTIDGEFFVSNSTSCISSFEKICEAFRDALPKINFFLSRSKNGRDYLNCRPAR